MAEALAMHTVAAVRIVAAALLLHSGVACDNDEFCGDDASCVSWAEFAVAPTSTTPVTWHVVDGDGKAFDITCNFPPNSGPIECTPFDPSARPGTTLAVRVKSFPVTARALSATGESLGSRTISEDEYIRDSRRSACECGTTPTYSLVPLM
jgi:hypothetical protein